MPRPRRLHHYSWPYDGVVEVFAYATLVTWTLGEVSVMALLAIGGFS